MDAVGQAMQPTDWTDRVCESPIYREMIGVYRGELINRSCRWDMQVSITGTNNGATCDLEAELNRNLLSQSVDGAYTCASGPRATRVASGLRVGHDLTTLRPTSVGFQYVPMLEETDDNGVELVHPIGQYENLTAEYVGLVGERGTLARQ